MRTDFPIGSLRDPEMASSEAVIRKCVHCGFCTATCPTYVLLGDELDSPRGRIYLIKDMLESQRDPSAEVVKHIDRCLSCLSCMSTCPSDVNYMHLIDHARAYVEWRYRRPWRERALRALLARLLPRPSLFRAALRIARLVRPAKALLDRVPPLKPLATLLDLAPSNVPAAARAISSPSLNSRGRVILLQGCAEPVLRPEIREAAVRLLNRVGYDVDFVAGEGCCGALVHHLGRQSAALDAARRNIDAWSSILTAAPIDAIIITASGCGTTVKDYGFMLREDAAYADKAARVSALANDIAEFLGDRGLPTGGQSGMTVAYHAACSLQHGQKVTDAPVRLLAGCGYTVVTPSEAHLCCGSAGTYNILQPELAGQLGDRKTVNIERLNPDVIATGNIGCATQIALRTEVPVVHTVELLDWATGGPAPKALTPTTRKKR